MAKRTRVTTSVSTLVSDLSLLKDIARMAGRKDVLKSLLETEDRVVKFVKEYDKLRTEVNSFRAKFLMDAEEVKA